MCMHAVVKIHICACFCGGRRLTPVLSLRRHPLCLTGTRSSLEAGACWLHKSDWPENPSDPPVCLPSVEITSAVYMPSLLHGWIPGVQLRFSLLGCKWFTTRSVPQLLISTFGWKFYLLFWQDGLMHCKVTADWRLYWGPNYKRVSLAKWKAPVRLKWNGETLCHSQALYSLSFKVGCFHNLLWTGVTGIAPTGYLSLGQQGFPKTYCGLACFPILLLFVCLFLSDVQDILCFNNYAYATS